MGKAVDVGKHLRAQHRPKALAGARRAVLADQRTAQSHQSQQHHHAAHLQHIGAVAVGNADVDNLCHDQRNDQLEDGFGQLENRSDDDFLAKSF